MILVFIVLPLLTINAVDGNWNDERGPILKKFTDLYRRGKVQNDAMEQYEQKIEELTSNLAEQQEQMQILIQNDKLKMELLEILKTNYNR